MALLDDYVDLDPIEAPSYDVPDNIYEFSLGDARIQEGTKNDPDKVALIFEYKLQDENDKSYTYSEWFFLPADANILTDRDKQSLGYLKLRLISLGVPESEVNEVEAADLIGTYGTLQIKTTVSKGRQFQNIRNLRVEENPEETVVAAPPVVTKAKRTRRTKAEMQVARAAEPTEDPEPDLAAQAEDEEMSELDKGLDARLAAVREAAAQESEEDSTQSIKERVAARRAARAAAANTSGERPNPFPKK